ncbi:hypothetical protein UT300007_11400 [Clostridium sp. CTA-7]
MYKDIENRLGAKIQDIKVLKSGWAGEIISLKFKDNTQKYVIKTYNSSKNGLENIKQEWKGLNLLYNANYPVPRPIMSDFVNEKPYIVMEEIEGENLWDCYQTLSKEDKDQLLERFVKVFFELHELDVSIVDKELVKDSTISFIEKEINEIKKLVEENKLEYFTQIIDWLQKEKMNIIGEKLSIIHRDYHPWNVIVDNNEKIYVIDLLWGIGDYRFDLAWMYTLMERSGFEDFSQNVLKKYKELKNGNINNFEYFKVLSTLRWLINVMISLKTGENLNETRNKEFENFVSPLIQKGIRSIQEITRIQIII